MVCLERLASATGPQPAKKRQLGEKNHAFTNIFVGVSVNTETSHLIPNSEGPLPPLPDPLAPLPEPPLPEPLFPQPVSTPQPVPQQFPPIQRRSLRCGCYLVNYSPNGSPLVGYDGTLRVECHSNGRTASGDLYQRQLVFFPPFPGSPPGPPQPILLPGPNPAAGIPILARGRYRYYLRVTRILEHRTFADSFTLGFEMYRFATPPTWTNEGAFTAQMTWTPAPAGYPSIGDYLAGDVRNSAGAVVGRLTMGWVSKYLRRATVEIDSVSASEAPLDNGAGVDWDSVFDGIGWDITVDESDTNVAEPSGAQWSGAEVHQALLARRDASNLDAEWRYHVLAVRELKGTPRGFMYDSGATDSNNVPREGVGIASHWVIPDADPWGLVRGMRFGTAMAPYFRTAVHELGHAQNLDHNTVDNGFMNTTDVIAFSGTATAPFPNNTLWSFAPDDQKRLRHYPDVFVRPGGTARGTASTTTPPITPTDVAVEIEGLELRVSPLLESVPLGAPVRVNVELINTSDDLMFAPITLSMKSGLVRGTVVDPSGTVRTFMPLVRCIEENPVGFLDPNQSIANSVTLLRGGQGALFVAPGVHRITVEAHWGNGGAEATVTGETSVMVTGAVDDAHSQAALKVLSTPDVLLTLVLGGDHLTNGIEAIETALENPVLRPHFAYVEAKRLAEPFREREANLETASALIEDSTIMSSAEIEKAARLVETEEADSAAGESIAETLKNKVRALDVGDEVKGIVDSL